MSDYGYESSEDVGYDGLPKYDKTREVTEVHNKGTDAITLSCSCKTSCSTARCKCNKTSAGCSPTCKCASYVNPFNELCIFFGRDKVDANSCFAAWIRKQNKKKGPNVDLTAEATRETLRCMLMGIKAGSAVNVAPKGDIFKDYMSDEMAAWAAEWVDPSLATERREEMIDNLLTTGLGVDSEDSIADGSFYSFCRKAGRRIHKQAIALLVENAWIGGSGIKCTYGVSIPCGGCGGVSDSYHDMKSGKYC